MESAENRAIIMMTAKNDMVDTTTIWLLFLFLGWSYGSMDKVGLQILFYLTLGGFGIWTLVRLFTLSGSIKTYNRNIALRHGLSADEMLKLGIYG